MPREHKHYEIKPARKPFAGRPLASTVLVTREDGQRGYCYINFSDSFVVAVGKALPRGVSLHDPAYLEVAFNHSAQAWEVMALYLASGKGKTLWRSPVKPHWLKFHQDRTHESTDSPDKAKRRRSRATNTGTAARSPSPNPDQGCTGRRAPLEGVYAP